jgi:hypothetical protein
MNSGAASALGLHVGSRVPVEFYRSGNSALAKITPFRRLDLIVLGVGVFNTQAWSSPGTGRRLPSCWCPA